MPPAEGSALGRAALSGNPSDGYGGATLAVTIPALAVRATVTSVAELGPSARAPAPQVPLVCATARRFDRELGADSRGLAIDWTSSIPRSVGLGGSSAIVIATVRALCSHHGLSLSEPDLAELALAVETEDLGIAAGLQDRVAQAFGGLTFMEFDPARGGPRYEPLPPELLPPLAVVWRTCVGEPSGAVHGDLRRRFEAGEPGVREAMTALGECARSARDALVDGDGRAFAAHVDRTFDLRASILALDPADVAMVSRARSTGAAANYTGSGGAVVACCRDETHRDRVLAALDGLDGCSAIALAPAPDIAI
jgi:glucuronokinase